MAIRIILYPIQIQLVFQHYFNKTILNILADSNTKNNANIVAIDITQDRSERNRRKYNFIALRDY